MPTINLKLWDKKSATFAMMVVKGKDSRAFRITIEQHAAIVTGGTSAAMATGVTQEEWETNLAIAYANGMEVGDVQIKSDNSTIIKIAEDTSKGDVVQDFMFFDPADIPGIASAKSQKRADLISVSSAVLMAAAKNFKIVADVDSIEAGVLIWR